MKLANAVQKRLKELMKEKQYTQYRLSKISGVNQSSISTLLNNKNDSCKLSLVYQLSLYLCGGLSEFFNSELFSQENIQSKYD